MSYLRYIWQYCGGTHLLSMDRTDLLDRIFCRNSIVLLAAQTSNYVYEVLVGASYVRFGYDYLPLSEIESLSFQQIRTYSTIWAFMNFSYDS